MTEPRDPQLLEHVERNGKILDALSQHSVDLDESREIDFFFRSPGKMSAKKLIERLRPFGRGEPAEEDDDGSQDVIVTTEMTPRQAASDEMVVRLVDAAADAGSKFEGWGTAI